MDTMEITKIVGGLCGALLILLLGKWAAETIYHVGGGHGEETAAYIIETDEGGTEEAAEETMSIAELLVSADVAKGEKVFGKCKACHKLEDGSNSTGPHLYGVVGRAIGAISEFSYSDTLAGLGGEWTPEDLSEFLLSPKSYAPGTKMSFAGLKKDTDRADLIAYLQTIGN